MIRRGEKSMGNLKYVNEATNITEAECEEGRLVKWTLILISPHASQAMYNIMCVAVLLLSSCQAELPFPTTFCNALSHPLLSRHNCLYGCVSIRVRKLPNRKSDSKENVS